MLQVLITTSKMTCIVSGRALNLLTQSHKCNILQLLLKVTRYIYIVIFSTSYACYALLCSFILRIAFVFISVKPHDHLLWTGDSWAGHRWVKSKENLELPFARLSTSSIIHCCSVIHC